MGIVLPLDVLVDRRGRVDAVDHEVELAVVVEIGIRRAVRKAGLLDAPFLALIGERQVAVVPEHMVGYAIAM